MIHQVKTKHIGGMSFESEIGNHKVILDSHLEFGGADRGPSPKKLLLSSLAGCTGMDVVSLLKKMRVNYTAFSIDVSAHLTEEHPKIYDEITIKYLFDGVEEKDYAKIEKAVTMSKERYCGVSAMLEKAAKIKFEVVHQ